jgi:hypothetical protein
MGKLFLELSLLLGSLWHASRQLLSFSVELTVRKCEVPVHLAGPCCRRVLAQICIFSSL